MTWIHRIILIAAVAGAVAPAKALTQPADTYIWQREVISNISPAADPLKAELKKLVLEMMATGSSGTDNGKLQPALYRPGILQNFLLYGTPSETVYILSDVYPLLDATTQTSVRTYLTSFMNTWAPITYTYIHGTTTWGSVAMARNRREYYPMPPNFMVNIWPPPTVPLETLYAMWRYADATGDWTYLSSRMAALTTLYNTYTAPATRYGQIMGLIGMARIAQHFGNTAQMNDAVSKATAAIGASDFNAWLSAAQTAMTRGGHDYCFPVFHFMHYDPVSGAFFCPELGRFIGTEQASAAQTAISLRTGATFATNGQATYPGWFINRADYAYGEYIYKNVPGWGQNAQGGENAYNTPDFSWTFFHLRAYVYGDSATDLKKMLDMPTCIGDLFYFQKLATTIRAYGTRTWVDVRTGSAPAAAPAGGLLLSATVVSGSEIDLSWTELGIDGAYVLERKTGASGTWAQVAKVAGNSFKNQPLASGVTYVYRVRPMAGGSGYSNEVTAQTPGRSAPAPR